MAGPDEREADRIYQEGLVTNDAIDISGFDNPRTFAEAEVFVEGLIGLNQFRKESTITGNSTSRPAGLRAFVTQIEGVIDELQRSGKLPWFLLSQAALHILNPAVSVPFGLQRQIVNPLAIIFGPPPFFGGLTTDAILPAIAYLNPVTDNNVDKLKLLYEGNEIEIVPEAGIPPVNIKGPKTRFPSDDGGGLDIADFIGGVTLDEKFRDLNIMDKEGAPQNTFENTTIFEARGDQSINLTPNSLDSKRAQFVDDGVLRPNLSALFDVRAVGPNFDRGGRGAEYSAIRRGFIQNLSDNMRLQRSAQKNIDSFMTSFTKEFEQNNGYLNFKLKDSDVVVPFYFQDLRAPERFLYFRAFLTAFNESITPEWNTERFYGRVDPVGTYMNTVRTFSVAFMIVAMSQEGLTTMWRKINNFCKMVYPTFDEENVLSRGPVVRLRIGDVCADEGGQGLPGWITNIEFDYTNIPWEILPFNGPTNLELGIAPMWALINFNFQVIHETTPKVDVNYNFPTRHFRRIGRLQDISTTQESQQNQSEIETQQTPDETSATEPASSDTGTSS